MNKLILALTFAMLASVVAGKICGNRKDRIKRRTYMYTWFCIDDNGKLTANTRTWTKRTWSGITGGVNIYLTDGNKQPIWLSETKKYGINGRAIPGSSDRRDDWTAQIPLGTLKKAKGWVIEQRHTPKPRFWSNIKKYWPEIVAGVKFIAAGAVLVG